MLARARFHHHAPRPRALRAAARGNSRALRLIGMLGLCLLFSALFPIRPALAQSLQIDLGGFGSFTGQVVKLVLLVTVLSLAPSILVMVTSFVRIVIVLSLLRTAIGLQQSPPNPVLVALALFLTLFVMMPTFETAWREGVVPLIEEEIEEEVALERVARPFHEFMRRQVREKDVALFLDIAGLEPPEKAEQLPWRVLAPAFMISELRRAFEIGFIVFIPFLIIDMVIACLLMAMGMMMLPPVMISLPFKLIFFVLVDGWYLLVGSLVESFARS